MNILHALQHHLNQHTHHKWELYDEWEENDDHEILNPFLGTTTPTIHIWQEDNHIHIRNTTLGLLDTLDLLDPEFLEKLQTCISQTVQP